MQCRLYEQPDGGLYPELLEPLSLLRWYGRSEVPYLTPWDLSFGFADRYIKMMRSLSFSGTTRTEIFINASDLQSIDGLLTSRVLTETRWNLDATSAP